MEWVQTAFAGKLPFLSAHQYASSTWFSNSLEIDLVPERVNRFEMWIDLIKLITQYPARSSARVHRVVTQNEFELVTRHESNGNIKRNEIIEGI